MRAFRCTLAAALLAACSALSPPEPQPIKVVLDSWPRDVLRGRPTGASILVLVPDAGAEYGTVRLAYSKGLPPPTAALRHEVGCH